MNQEFLSILRHKLRGKLNNIHILRTKISRRHNDKLFRRRCFYISSKFLLSIFLLSCCVIVCTGFFTWCWNFCRWCYTYTLLSKLNRSQELTCSTSKINHTLIVVCTIRIIGFKKRELRIVCLRFHDKILKCRSILCNKLSCFIRDFYKKEEINSPKSKPYFLYR